MEGRATGTDTGMGMGVGTGSMGSMGSMGTGTRTAMERRRVTVTAMARLHPTATAARLPATVGRLQGMVRPVTRGNHRRCSRRRRSCPHRHLAPPTVLHRLPPTWAARRRRRRTWKLRRRRPAELRFSLLQEPKVDTLDFWVGVLCRFVSVLCRVVST